MNLKDNFLYELEKLEGIKIFSNASIKEENHMKLESVFLYKIEIYSYKNIRKLFSIIKKYNYKYYIIGMGSNILLKKEYYEGIVIKLMPIYYKNPYLLSAGSSLNYINCQFIKSGISSLNFLCGVPCSIGGAVCMNAGAFNKEIKDIIEKVYYLDLNDLKIKVKNNFECDFKYRDSYFRSHDCLILLVRIKLIYKDEESLFKEYKENLIIRNNKLPLEYPNLGSVFKNGRNYSVGKLIDEMGIKGLSLNGAKISEKHGNVIVNYNNAKGKDIIKLIEIIEELFYIKYKIYLQREIIIFK